MKTILIMLVLTLPAMAQHGSAYPKSGRGEAFPKNVPNSFNALNWIAQRHQYTDPYGPNSRRYYTPYWHSYGAWGFRHW